MSSVNPLTPDKKKEILQHLNDVAHSELNENNVIVLAKHDKADPRMFEIVADSVYDKKLEGVKMIFNNAEEFKSIFPEFAQPLPVDNPPNTEPNPETGRPEGIHKDPYKPVRVLSIPKVDHIDYKAENAIDGDLDTIFGIKQLNARYFLDFGKDIDMGAVWIAWSLGDERQFKFTVAVSSDGRSFNIIKHLKSVYTSGKSKDFEPYNLSQESGKLVKARYLMIQGEGNTKNLNWFTISEAKVTKARSVTSSETDKLLYENVWKDKEEPIPEPTKPTPEEPEKPTESEPQEPTTQGSDVYPLPSPNRVYKQEIAAKNRGVLLSGKLPLLSRLDKNGLPYTDIMALIKRLKLPLVNRSLNFNHENYRPTENNNKGDENGKSLRNDFKSYMPQFELNNTMLSRSKVNEQYALKYGGIHTDGDDDVYADCLIVRLHMNGKLIECQLEPRHMAPKPFGYGEKFNQVEIPASIIGNTKDKKMTHRLIKLNDVKNNCVYVIWAVDKTGQSRDFDLLYMATIHDGMGGNRVIKDPFCQWCYHVKKKLDYCNITMRMDGQLNYTLKKGDNYDHSRVTEIVGLEA